MVTVLLLGFVRVAPAGRGVAGATGFVLLTLGYSAAAQLQDLFYDPTLFALVGVVVGPFAGIAKRWSRRPTEAMCRSRPQDERLRRAHRFLIRGRVPVPR